MITNNHIRRFLGLPLVKEMFVVRFVDSLSANNNAVMFISKKGVDLDHLDDICESCVFLVDDSYEEKLSKNHNDFIRVRNPKYKFCLVVEEFKLSSSLQMCFLVTPEEYERTKTYSRLTHCREITIGSNCRFDDGVILGGEDFSPVLSDSKELVSFPQLGGVRIGNNVVIKYNSMVGKGTFDYTVIGDNTMIDYGCQVGHNCKIGKSCIIAAGTIIGGSTTIGDNTVIGIGAKIRNGLRIGKNVSVGMGSVVIKDVPDNCVVVGNPARIIEHDHIFNEEGLV